LLKRAAAGQPQAVFVSGESGIGKTTFIQALIAQARRIPGLVVAQGQCIGEFCGMESYYPVLDALSGLCSGPERSLTIRVLLNLAPTRASQLRQVQTKQRETVQLSIGGAGPDGA
jgi:ABC-type branched-subunit amino acid transport system ATPase component